MIWSYCWGVRGASDLDILLESKGASDLVILLGSKGAQ